MGFDLRTTLLILKSNLQWLEPSLCSLCPLKTGYSSTSIVRLPAPRTSQLQSIASAHRKKKYYLCAMSTEWRLVKRLNPDSDVRGVSAFARTDKRYLDKLNNDPVAACLMTTGFWRNFF